MQLWWFLVGEMFMCVARYLEIIIDSTKLTTIHDMIQ